MVETLLYLAIPVAITAGLAVLIAHWRIIRRFERLVVEESCKVCGGSLSDTLPTFLGRVTADDLTRLDAFQKRFARYRICCNNCSSICICTKDGAVMAGYVIRDD